MAKKESTFSNMLLTLFIITLASSAALGLVHKITSEPIAAAMAAKKNLAITKVTPAFDNNPADEVFSVPAGTDSVYFHTAKNGNDTVGFAAETFSNMAFGGSLKLLVGFLPDGTIKEIAVLEHKETPGLGDKIMKSKSDWSTWFEGKNPAEFVLKVKKDGGDVDAITAATITSRAYCDAVQRAYNALTKGGEQ